MKANESLVALKEILNEQGRILKLTSIPDVVRRDCALLILQSIVEFLQSLCNKEERMEIPEYLIRESFAMVLSELGPGDQHLRMVVLDSLRRSTSLERQVLLDILPFSMPLDKHEREIATSVVLEVFKDVLLKDSSSLLPIIGTLSTLSLSDKGRQEAWKLAIVSIAEADADEFPILVQSLLHNVASKDEALYAFRRIREEVQDVLFVGNLVLLAMQERDHGILLRDAYLDLLEQLNVASSPTSDLISNGITSSILQLDLIVLLELYHRPLYKSKVESFLDDMLLSNSFPFVEVLWLISMLRPRESSLVQEVLPMSLMELGLFLLVAPVRLLTIDTTFIMAQTHKCMIQLVPRLDRSQQDELVRSLLHLGDEVDLIFTSSTKRRKGEVTYKDRTNITSQALYGIVISLASDDPSIIIRSKFLLLERLTSERQSSASIAICAIVVSLLDRGHGSGIDTSDLMILVQKLLFWSSGPCSDGSQQKNASMIARGLQLARFMIQSNAFDVNDKDDILQWVLNILLPLNRRTVHPAIGSNGLDFLSTWALLNQGIQGNVFKHVKMIMANTGLVQVKEVYLERKQTDVDLAYNEIPSGFVTKGMDSSKENTRNLMFCVGTFLKFRGLLSPTNWTVEVHWVFTLVDTYLQLGRKQSSSGKISKWLPDGWLTACIELPAFPCSTDDQTNNNTTSFFQNYVAGETIKRAPLLNQLRSAFLGEKNFLSRKKYLESIMQLTVALLLSLGLSIAVLRNGRDHLSGLNEAKTTNDQKELRKRDVLNLLKYQLLKVYDLQHRLLCLLKLVESLEFTMKRRRKINPDEVDLLDQTLFSEATSHGHNALSALMTTSLQLDAEFVKVCLIEESDSEFLFQALDQQNVVRSNSIVNLRLQILEHAISAYHTNKATTLLIPDVLGGMYNVLASLFPRMKEVLMHAHMQVPSSILDAAHLSSAYLEYIICTIDNVIYAPKLSAESGLEVVLEGMVCSQNGQTRINSTAADLFDQFLLDLQGLTDSSLAILVVEVIALIASVDPENLMPKALDVCWEMMHTVYPLKLTTLKSRTTTLFRRVSSSFLECAGVSNQRSKILQASIVKCSLRQAKDITEHSAAQRSLLLLWSLIIQPVAARGKEACILSSLVDDIETYLQTSKENMNPDGRSAQSRKTARASLPSIPNLNGATLNSFVEMTSQMIVSAFAVIEPARCQGNMNPFSHLSALPRLFGRLIAVIVPNLHIFPKRFVPLLISSGHHLLEATLSQVQACVDWRNSQPLLTADERQAGKKDMASIRYLEEFLQDVCISSCGAVASFCSQACKPVDKMGCTYKMTALFLAAERTAGVLKQVALTHNVLPAEDPFNGNTISKLTSLNTICRDVDRVQESHSNRKKQCVPQPVIDHGANGASVVEHERDDQEHQQYQGFVVDGGWGSDGSDEQSAFSTGLELKYWTVSS